MGEKTCEIVQLSEIDFEVNDISVTLTAIFDKHRNKKEEEAKVTLFGHPCLTSQSSFSICRDFITSMKCILNLRLQKYQHESFH